MQGVKPRGLLLWGTVLAVAACGGGGETAQPEAGPGGSSEDAGQVFTSADAVRLANEEVTSVVQFSGASSGDITSAEDVVDILNTITAAEAGVLAVTANTYFCSSPDPQNTDTGNGSVTITNDDQDPAGRSTGDSVTTAFDQCSQFGAVVNGTTSNTINELAGEPFVAAPWAVDTTHTTDLSRTGSAGSSTTTRGTSSARAESPDGVVIVRTSTGEGSRSATDPSGNTSDWTSRFSFQSTTDLNAQTRTAEFDSVSTSGTRTNSAKTLTAVSGPLNGAPTVGVIEISHTDTAAGVNRLVRVTLQPDGSALMEVDTDGDGAVDQTFTAPWFGGIGFGGGFGGGLGSPAFGGGWTMPPAAGGSPVPPIPPTQPPETAPPPGPQPPVSSVPPTPPSFGGIGRFRPPA